MLFSRFTGHANRLLQQYLILALFALFVTPAHSASKTIVVLGDSLSAEYGLTRGKGWVQLLDQRLQQKNIPAKVINASISGDTTSSGKSRLGTLLKKHHPDIVIIELGGNDALRGLSLKASEANFNSMIDMAKKQNAKVLLAAMKIPPNYGPDYSEQFFAMFGRLAKANKIALIPFLLEGIAEKNELFQADRIHPVAEAHPAILDNVWQHLQPLLSK
ncbi:arylesterase [Undibacterium sp. TS12]|uniref:arylesterase n=1 Tax=Undibacterium sp. TS12 TaxID=2908202 RepID=UPI001F4CB946|nr:arylesterase [Undibacterium sp. TS12]MCH8621669.1 arylesterase [Undibacterium sp. TS12]